MNKEYRKADLICLFFISILGSLVGFLLTIFPNNKSLSYIIALSSCIAVVLPISKTIRTLNITNRTFDTKETYEYNELANKNEGSFYDERNNIHETRRLSTSGFGTTGTTGESGIGKVVGYEENLSKTASQNQILQLSDNRNSNSTLVGGSTKSSRVGRNLNQTDGGETRGDGATESGRYDEVGGTDEQHQTLGTGDSKRTGDIRLEYYDRQHEDKTLMVVIY